MLTAPSSRRFRRSFWSIRIRLVLAVSVLAMLPRAAADARDVQLARFSEENLPAQDMPSMPSVAATPAAASSPAAEWMVVPASSATGSASAPVAPPESAPAENPPLSAGTNAAQLEPTPMASPTDVAPLEVGSVAPQLEISDGSLDDVIQRVSTTQPALAASLRVTDQARDQIMKHREGDAIQTLGRAISIDGSNPYAYFYLGRAYLAKKNYEQANTFLNRAEIHFAANPEWLGETLAFEGLANEQAGQTASAIACYQKALAAVPGNLMARVGLTRLSAEQNASPVQPVSEPAASEDAPADASSEGSAVPPPPDAPPPQPTN